MSGNSRSLLLLRLHSEQLLDLQKLSFLNGEKAFEIVKALIAGKSKKICQQLNSRMEAVNEASQKLKRLQRLDKFIFEEKGTYDLHVGWPMVRGKFSDGTLVRCPLLYFPVSLVLDSTHWVLAPREDAGITFNKSFLLAYSYYNKVRLEDDLLNSTFEDFDRDSMVFRTQLYQLLKETVELNFNSETFTDDLSPFQEFKKEEFESHHRSGEIKLFPEAVLGIFPQAGSQLVTDYHFLIENQEIQDLEQFFSSGINGESNHVDKWIPTVKEEKIYAPFSLDACQEHALRIIKDGKSLVVQGPPGTGKSQLIANLIADSIASGKKVLMVCQKRVALDVVYDRLKKIELADFIGLVHDFRNDRKAIYEKIARQVDHIDDFKARDRSIDIIQVERRFFHVCRTIDQLIETLEEFRYALFDESEFGISVKELYLTSNPKSSSINVRQEYQYFDLKKIGDFSSKIHRYAQYAETLEQDQYPWLNRKSFSNFLINDLREIKRTVRDVPEAQQRIQQELLKFISSPLNLEECESLLQREQEIEKMMSLLSLEAVYNSFQRMMQEDDNETSLLWLQNIERVCMNCFDGVGVEHTIESSRLGMIQEALYKRTESRKGIIRRIRWELSDQKFLLKRVLVENDLKFNKEGLVVLEQRIDNRMNLEHHLTTIRDKNWLAALPMKVDKQKLKQWFDHKLSAIRAKLILNSLRELRKSINMERTSQKQFQQIIQSVLEIIGQLSQLRNEWSKFLSPYQIQQLIANPQLEKEYVSALERDFDKLIEFDRIKESLVEHEKNILVKLFDEITTWNSSKMELLFQNSIRLAWIEHMETKYPVLRSVSTFKMDEMQKELQQAMVEKQQLSTQILLLRARERVYGNMEYNRLNNRVTYRDLYHQVTKKKKIWPVRKVVAEFSEELFNLMPCWMASPEAVSAIFPMRQLFDLVIFDEASQCFSERGIPAMYRAKQALVAGDSKQLKPFELYQARWEEEHENPDLEVDSLLELSERYLPTVQLQGHYRSQSMALIDFSNQFFYEGNLKLLPDRKISNDRTPPIEFHKVTGLWENQTNPLEAEAVVRYAFDWIRKHPEKEIGIITFNAPQQMLLMDVMEEASAKEGLVIPESLFIKNIENVQGDERDIIIFSVGYAPGKDGKMNMQFGSLNIAGGENRLNVAVTRAREKIVVISSIQAEELKLQGIKNEGPKLLKKYLEFSRQVSEGNFKLQRLPVEKHSSDWYLSKQLMSRNSENNALSLSYSLFSLPFTDVLVQQGHDQLGVLLTDDQLYHTSPTVKEPHFYTPHLLQRKNWRYLRVFSRSWWMDREKTENELSKFTYQLTNEN